MIQPRCHEMFFLSLIIWLLSPLGKSPAADSELDEKIYVCPPCGHDCLNTTFDKPGACGECGMQLVSKASLADPARSQAMTAGTRAPSRNVAILLFEGVQIIDYTGPFEIFGAAGFDVFTVAETSDLLRTTYGMQVKPDYTLSDSPQPDIILVPGGQVFHTQKDPDVQAWLRKTAMQAEIVLSVCNGAFILAKSGLLNGLTATTTRPLVDGLAVAAPNIEVAEDTRFVDNGKIVTSGGLSAGMDAALHIVARLLGRARAQSLADGLEYEWRSEGLIVER